MSHHSPRRRPATFTSLIALTATLVATSLGLAACGGSSSTTTTTETTANAAATGTTTAGTGTSTAGTGTSGSTSTGTSSTGTSSTGTTPGASTTGTTPAATPAARSARFAAVRTCLSKKGITLPQRGAGGFAGGAGGGAQLPKGMSQAQFAEALRSCGDGFNGSHFGKDARGFHNPFNNPRFHAALLRFAACLRQNGINLGEPNTTGKGPVFATKGINTGSPQFKAAAAKCRSTLLGALKSNRAHPGASAG